MQVRIDNRAYAQRVLLMYKANVHTDELLEIEYLQCTVSHIQIIHVVVGCRPICGLGSTHMLLAIHSFLGLLLTVWFMFCTVSVSDGCGDTYDIHTGFYRVFEQWIYRFIDIDIDIDTLVQRYRQIIDRVVRSKGRASETKQWTTVSCEWMSEREEGNLYGMVQVRGTLHSFSAGWVMGMSRISQSLVLRWKEENRNRNRNQMSDRESKQFSCSSSSSSSSISISNNGILQLVAYEVWFIYSQFALS